MPPRARPDGTPISTLSPIRRIMPFIMAARNGSYVLFEQTIDAAPAKRLLDKLNAKRPPDRPITIFHLLLRSLGNGFHEFPRMNRVVAGSRLYQRRGIWLAFSAKLRFDIDAPLFTRKLTYDPSEPLGAMVDRIYSSVGEGRSGRESASDKEVRLFLRLPASLLRMGVRLVRLLDTYNLLPAKFIQNDPLYASIFVANLGSVGLDAAYHHLYEYGTIPIFVTMGRLFRAPVVLPDGSIGSREVFQLRYTYDERIEDGFYAARTLERVKSGLEDPESIPGATSG